MSLKRCRLAACAPPRTFLVNERMCSEVEICVETEMEIWMDFAVDFVGANT